MKMKKQLFIAAGILATTFSHVSAKEVIEGRVFVRSGSHYLEHNSFEKDWIVTRYKRLDSEKTEKNKREQNNNVFVSLVFVSKIDDGYQLNQNPKIPHGYLRGGLMPLNEVSDVKEGQLITLVSEDPNAPTLKLLAQNVEFDHEKKTFQEALQLPPKLWIQRVETALSLEQYSRTILSHI